MLYFADDIHISKTYSSGDIYAQQRYQGARFEFLRRLVYKDKIYGPSIFDEIVTTRSIGC